MKGVAFYALINCEWLCFWVNGIQSDDLNLGQGVLFSLLDHIPQKVGVTSPGCTYDFESQATAGIEIVPVGVDAGSEQLMTL